MNIITYTLKFYQGLKSIDLNYIALGEPHWFVFSLCSVHKFICERSTCMLMVNWIDYWVDQSRRWLRFVLPFLRLINQIYFKSRSDSVTNWMSNIMLPAVSNLCLNITFFLCRLQYPDDMLCPFWHLGKEVCLWQYWWYT